MGRTERGKTYRMRVSEELILKAFTEGMERPAARCIEGLREPIRIRRIEMDGIEPGEGAGLREIHFYVETAEPAEEPEFIEDFACTYKTVERED